jgi:hypothetical protein
LAVSAKIFTKAVDFALREVVDYDTVWHFALRVATVDSFKQASLIFSVIQDAFTSIDTFFSRSQLGAEPFPFVER